MDEETYAKITDKIIGKYNTLTDATFGAVPRPLASLLSALIKTERYIGIAYIIEGKLYGTSLLAMAKNQPDPSDEILQNIAFLVAVSIRRKRAEEALLAEQLRLENIIEGTRAGTWEWNVQTGETVFNEQWAKIIGYTPDELKPMNISVWEKYAHPDDLEQSNNLLQRHFAGELPYYDYECRMKHKDGSWVWVQDRGRVITRTVDGKPLMMYGTHSDINERKKSENALKESEANLSAIFNATDESVILISADETIISLNDTAAKRMTQPMHELIGQKVCDLFPPEVVMRRMPMIKQVTETGESLIFEDQRNGHWLMNHIYPILDQAGKVSRMAIFARDITEQKQAEKALQDSESQYRLLAENVTDVIWVQDLETGKFRFVSPSFERLFGYTVEYALETGVENLMTPDSLEYMRNAVPGRIERFTNGYREIFADELRYVHKNGSIIWVKTNSKIILNPYSGRLEATGVMHDITERKRVQDDLSESEARFRRLFESASLAIFQTTPDGKVISVNPAFVKMFGYNSQDEVKNKISNVSIDLFADPTRRSEIIRLLEINPELSSFENIYRRKDGSTFVGWLNVSRINDQDGRFDHMEGFIEDITQRKLAEEAVLKSKLQYDKLAANIPVGVYVLHSKADGSFKLDYASPRMAEMLGLSVEGLLNDASLVYESIYPDDRALFAQLNQDGIRLKKTFDWTGRILTDGKISWLRVTSSPEVLEDGDVLWHGLVVDITKEKLAEDAINEAHNRLLKITSHVPGVVYQYRLNPDGSSCFPFASEGISKIYGMSAEEVRKDASKVFARIHPDDLPGVAASIQTSATDLLPWYREYRGKFDDGTVRWLSGNAVPQRETDGSVLWHGFISDITERKQAEQVLKQSESRFKNLFDYHSAIMLLVEPVTGSIIDANDAAEHFYGYSKSLLKTMNIHELNVLSEKEVKYEREKARNRNLNYFVFQHKLASGEERTVEVHSSPIDFQEKQILFSIIHDITDRKLAENKLLGSEQRYRQLVETANEGIVVAQGNNFKFANPSATELSGYTEEELLSTPFIDFIYPDDRALVAGNYLKRLKGETADQSYIFRFIGKGNNLKWVEMSGIKIDWDGQPASLNFVSDITARKQAEDALIESEKHANALIGAFPDLMFIINQQGIFIDYRADIQDLYVQTEAIIGKRIRDIMPATFADLIEEKVNRTLQNGVMQIFEYQLDMPSRGIADYEARMVPYGNDQVVAVVRDVTERKKAEKEVIRKNEDLVKVNAEKDKFFSIIAHDLRGPIGGFLGLTERMAEGMAEMTLDELQHIARVMKKSSSNLYSLLGNLLAWSRMQRGLTTFDPVSLLLLPKINEILLLPHESAEKKEIAVDISVPADLEVNADGNMLASIIRNFVTNALKFTPHGGRISISAKPVSGKLIEISISDSGVGMSRNMIENLFNLDVNTNRKGTDGELSTGLGLMICKDFIEKHGGKLIVESEEGKGSTFRFVLPAGTQTEEVFAVDEAIPVTSSDEQPKQLKILIAEDDETSGMLLAIALKPISRKVLTVCTGTAAVEMCKNNPDIDLIMMDIEMPGLSGYEATTKIRQFNSRVVIIAQTAFGMEIDRSKAIDAGCNEYMLKPLSLTVLKSVIQKHFKNIN